MGRNSYFFSLIWKVAIRLASIWFLPEVGKVALKSNGDEVLNDEFLIKSNGDDAFNDEFLIQSDGDDALNDVFHKK